MRGSDERTRALFSYVDVESRIRFDHPLRRIREWDRPQAVYLRFLRLSGCSLYVLMAYRTRIASGKPQKSYGFDPARFLWPLCGPTQKSFPCWESNPCHAAFLGTILN